MKNEKGKKTPYFITVTAFIIFIVLGLGSCASAPQQRNHSYPLTGNTNDVNIATKDFSSVGIVFVRAVEVIDNQGNHTGSKITYRMFMEEAQKLQADDVINIKIDVNVRTEKQNIGVETRIVNTYTYSGTGLAIKYTGAIATSSNTNKAQNFSNAIPTIDNTEEPPKKPGVIARIALGLLVSISLVAMITTGT